MPDKIWQMCGSDTAKCKLTVNPHGVSVSLGKLR